MIPPYGSNEIAEAILTAGRAGSLGWTLLDVTADEVTNSWVIRIRETGSEPRRLFFPFSSPRGIYTPSEIARHLLEGRWPFGESS